MLFHYTVPAVEYRICILPLCYLRTCLPFKIGRRRRLRLSSEDSINEVHIYSNVGFGKIFIVPKSLVSNVGKLVLSFTDQNLE